MPPLNSKHVIPVPTPTAPSTTGPSAAESIAAAALSVLYGVGTLLFFPAYAEYALPVIADESCLVEQDVDRCRSFFHGINIKLTKAGGLTPARRMIRKARELGLKVMVGCMAESTVGISAIAQLLPLLDHVDLNVEPGDSSAYSNIYFTLQVYNRLHLAQIMRALRRTPEVIRIARVNH